MNDDWLGFGVNVASVGQIYGKQSALWNLTTGTTRTFHHAIEWLETSCVGKQRNKIIADEKTANKISFLQRNGP